MTARPGVGASAMVFLSLFWVYWLFGTIMTSTPPAGPGEIPVTHVALLKFRAEATPKQVKHTTQNYFALRDHCFLPNTTTRSNVKYIRSIWGGRENLSSPATATNGPTHLFVVDFNSAREREYFYNEDPCYKKFQKFTTNILEGTASFEFTNGIFDPKEKKMPWGFEQPEKEGEI